VCFGNKEFSTGDINRNPISFVFWESRTKFTVRGMLHGLLMARLSLQRYFIQPLTEGTKVLHTFIFKILENFFIQTSPKLYLYQCLVFSPFAAITTWIWLGINNIELWYTFRKTALYYSFTDHIFRSFSWFIVVSSGNPLQLLYVNFLLFLQLFCSWLASFLSELWGISSLTRLIYAPKQKIRFFTN